MKEKKSKNRFLLIFFLTICLCSIGYLVFDNLHIKKTSVEIREDVTLGNSPQMKRQDSVVEKTTKHDVNRVTLAPTYYENIDFNALQDINPDIFAWIKIPGTEIDYPIVQHPTNDEYYLKHGADGMISSYGCPYIELTDSKTFDEFNTVVYGHNMNDGSMFAGLHQFEKIDFFNEHREIDVYTAEHFLCYEIFAAVMYCDDHIPYYYNDNVLTDRLDFLNSLKTNSVLERTIISEQISVYEKDRIITLSTCDKKLRDKRYIVVGVLRQIDGTDV